MPLNRRGNFPFVTKLSLAKVIGLLLRGGPFYGDLFAGIGTYPQSIYWVSFPFLKFWINYFKNPYKRFIKKICNGVIENNSLLEEKLISFLDKKFDLKNFEIIFSIILKSAIYEIFFYKKTPFKVVIDEYLKITKMFLNDKQKNIINAVLDKIAKSV